MNNQGNKKSNKEVWIHVLLAMFTVGIGNLLYLLYKKDKINKATFIGLTITGVLLMGQFSHNEEIKRNETVNNTPPVVVATVIPTIMPTSEPTVIPTLSPEEIQERTKKILHEKLMSHFSVWDGSHHQSNKLIKNALKNPASYDFVKCTWSGLKEEKFAKYYIVTTTYRATNSFNAIVTSQMTIRFDLSAMNDIIGYTQVK